jgi:nucleoside-diphosphate-sugar epimerase
MREARHIAMTGATGFVGQALMDLALEQGLEVTALTRKPQAARAGVRWVLGDLNDAEALADLMQGAEAVVHVAGVVNAPTPAEFEAGNVAGTLAVLTAAAASGVRRFVHVSSLSAREPQLSAYGASKARAERLVKSSGLDWTIVRPPAIYGPRDRDLLELFRMAKWGVVTVPLFWKRGAGRMAVIHVDDLARLLLVLAGRQNAPIHRAFEPDDGLSEGWGHASFARAIGWAMERRVRVLPLPRMVLIAAAWADRLARRGGARLTRDRVGYMTHDDWVPSAGARVPRTLWKPQIVTRLGLRATAEWYRREGWL